MQKNRQLILTRLLCEHGVTQASGWGLVLETPGFFPSTGRDHVNMGDSSACWGSRPQDRGFLSQHRARPCETWVTQVGGWGLVLETPGFFPAQGADV
jgi:hypothetical protein